MRRGFTLIELLVVVAVIGMMISIAVATVTGGRGAAHVRDASRAVVQMSRYASSLALLRQRPVVVTYRRNRIDVQISGEATQKEDLGSPAKPIYMEVTINDETIDTVEAEEQRAEEKEKEGPEEKVEKESALSDPGEKAGLFFTRTVLDPEELTKEDATREFSDVSFTVEVLGEDGEPLTIDQAIVNSLAQPRPPQDATEEEEGADKAKEKRRVTGEETADEDIPISITYETNGNCTPYRVIIHAGKETDREVEEVEGLVVEISRSGKPEIENEDELARRRKQ